MLSLVETSNTLIPVVDGKPVSKGKASNGKSNATQRKYQNDLDGLINDAKLTRHETDSDGKVRVDCPFNPSHIRDAFVNLDAEGYPRFSCNHNSCSSNKFNEMVKQAGIEEVSKSKADADIPKTFDGLPVVMLSEENGVVMAKARHVVSDVVATHLWKNESIFRRGIFLGTLRRGEDAPVFVRSEIPSIGGDISRSCALMRHSKVGVPSTVANPPGWLCADILHNQPVDKVREVRVIVSHPFFNGENLVTAKGYDSWDSNLSG